MPADSIAVSLRNFGIGRPGDGDRLKVFTILRLTIGIDDKIMTPYIAYRIRRPISAVRILSTHSLYAIFPQPVCKTSRSEVSISGSNITSSQAQCAILKSELTVAYCRTVGVIPLRVADYSARAAITAFPYSDIPAIARIFSSIL